MEVFTTKAGELMRLTDLDVRKLKQFMVGKLPPFYLIVVQLKHRSGRAIIERSWWAWTPKKGVEVLATAGW